MCVASTMTTAASSDCIIPTQTACTPRIVYRHILYCIASYFLYYIIIVLQFLAGRFLLVSGRKFISRTYIQSALLRNIINFRLHYTRTCTCLFIFCVHSFFFDINDDIMFYVYVPQQRSRPVFIKIDHNFIFEFHKDSYYTSYKIPEQFSQYQYKCRHEKKARRMRALNISKLFVVGLHEIILYFPFSNNIIQ